MVETTGATARVRAALEQDTTGELAALSQRELAARLGVDQSTISRVKRQREGPHAHAQRRATSGSFAPADQADTIPETIPELEGMSSRGAGRGRVVDEYPPMPSSAPSGAPATPFLLTAPAPRQRGGRQGGSQRAPGRELSPTRLGNVATGAAQYVSLALDVANQLHPDIIEYVSVGLATLQDGKLLQDPRIVGEHPLMLRVEEARLIGEPAGRIIAKNAGVRRAVTWAVESAEAAPLIAAIGGYGLRVAQTDTSQLQMRLGIDGAIERLRQIGRAVFRRPAVMPARPTRPAPPVAPQRPPQAPPAAQPGQPDSPAAPLGDARRAPASGGIGGAVLGGPQASRLVGYNPIPHQRPGE